MQKVAWEAAKSAFDRQLIEKGAQQSTLGLMLAYGALENELRKANNKIKELKGRLESSARGASCQEHSRVTTEQRQAQGAVLRTKTTGVPRKPPPLIGQLPSLRVLFKPHLQPSNPSTATAYVQIRLSLPSPCALLMLAFPASVRSPKAARVPLRSRHDPGGSPTCPRPSECRVQRPQQPRRPFIWSQQPLRRSTRTEDVGFDHVQSSGWDSRRGHRGLRRRRSVTRCGESTANGRSRTS